MQENTPISDNTLSSEETLGENLKLLISHREFDRLIDGENSKKEEDKK